MINVNGKNIETIQELRECFLVLNVENSQSSLFKELMDCFYDGDIYVFLREHECNNMAKRISMIEKGGSKMELMEVLRSVVLHTDNTDIIVPVSDEADIVMKHIAAGDFWMGAQKTNPGECNYDVEAMEDENPVHFVSLDDYYIGETEVTQAVWETVMGNNPSRFIGKDLPVEQVGWNDCMEFVRKLNSTTGWNFRFPTEAEWEYAARGGKKSRGYKYSGSDNVDEVRIYNIHHGETYPVKSKKANELGLYDMSGNVHNWCQDYYGPYCSNQQNNPVGPKQGYRRVARGACASSANYACRITERTDYPPDNRGSWNGFRLALSL